MRREVDGVSVAHRLAGSETAEPLDVIFELLSNLLEGAYRHDGLPDVGSALADSYGQWSAKADPAELSDKTNPNKGRQPRRDAPEQRVPGQHPTFSFRIREPSDETTEPDDKRLN